MAPGGGVHSNLSALALSTIISTRRRSVCGQVPILIAKHMKYSQNLYGSPPAQDAAKKRSSLRSAHLSHVLSLDHHAVSH